MSTKTNFMSWSIQRLSHSPSRSCFRRSFFDSSYRSQKNEKKVSDSDDTARIIQEIDAPDVKAEDTLGPLRRPLGVTERPTTLLKTRTQRVTELLTSEDARIEQRRHLIKEVARGYYYDMNMTRKHGGKTWIAPKSMIREDKALYLPDIKGKSIDTSEDKHTTLTCFGRVTVLAMINTRMSEVHVKGFVDPTNERYGTHPLYQYMQINLQENLLKSLLVKLFINSLRSYVPKSLHSTYLLSNQNMEYVRDALGMTNARVGYVYLIDENLKIRWGGCADATQEEALALETCTGVLLKRAEKTTGHHSGKKPDEPSQPPQETS